MCGAIFSHGWQITYTIQLKFIRYLENQKPQTSEELNAGYDALCFRLTKASPVILTALIPYLSSSDRFVAAHVCRQWQQVFSSPALWKTFNCRFSTEIQIPDAGPEDPCDGNTAIDIVKIYGCHIKRLKIVGQETIEENHISMGILKNTIIQFFDSLGKSGCQLNQFNMCTFQFDTWPTTLRNEIAVAIGNFLITQSDLHFVRLSHCNMAENMVVHILRLLVARNVFIRSLCLEDVSSVASCLHRNSCYRQIMCKWKYLRRLSLNYSAINEGILSSMINVNLKDLKITIQAGEKRDHVISSEKWTEVVKVASNLSITLEFVCVPKFEDNVAILQKEAPIACINYYTGYPQTREPNWQCNELIKHIGLSYSATLRHLELYIFHEENIDFALFNLVCLCIYLDILVVKTKIRVHTVDQLCALRLQQKTGIAKMHIFFWRMEPREIPQLKDLHIIHRAMIQRQHLDYKFEIAF